MKGAGNSATGKNSLSIGQDNEAISENSVAMGNNNIAGLKGWYYGSINKINDTTIDVYISDSQRGVLNYPTWGGTTKLSNLNPYAVLGNNTVVSLINDVKYDNKFKVIGGEAGRIRLQTVSGNLPFSSIAIELLLDPEDYSIYCLSKPTAGAADVSLSSIAEGRSTKALGACSHAEGYNTTASGKYSHVEGRDTEALYIAHAEGSQTKALGNASHSEGTSTQALNSNAHAEGFETEVRGYAGHGEGKGTKVLSDYGHSEGELTEVSANSKSAHAEGIRTKAANTAAHAEGRNTIASGVYSHAEGYNDDNNEAYGAFGAISHTEGYATVTTSNANSGHAEGRFTTVSNLGAHSEGISTTASGEASHAEGKYTIASGEASHAEGKGESEANPNLASGKYSHVEGEKTKATNTAAHAEGMMTTSSGKASHTEGRETQALADYAHSEGYLSIVVAGATGGHSEGIYNIVNNYAEHAQGKYNKSNTNTIHSVGIGTSDTNRKNAHEIMDDGKHYIIGIGGYDGTNPSSSKDLATILSTVDTSNANKFIAEKSLEVNGATTLNGSLGVSGATTLNGSLGVTNDTTIGGTLRVDSDTIIDGTLGVTNDTIIDGDLRVDSDTIIDGTLGVTNDTIIDGDLTVYSNTNLYGSLSVYEDVQCYSNLNVDENTTLNGDVTLGSSEIDTIIVNGNTNFKADVNMEGYLDVEKGLNVNGKTTLYDDLSVAYNTYLNNSVFISGQTYAENMYANLLIPNDIMFYGLTSLKETLFENNIISNYVVNFGSKFIPFDNDGNILYNNEYSFKDLLDKDFDTSKVYVPIVLGTTNIINIDPIYFVNNKEIHFITSRKETIDETSYCYVPTPKQNINFTAYPTNVIFYTSPYNNYKYTVRVETYDIGDSDADLDGDYDLIYENLVRIIDGQVIDAPVNGEDNPYHGNFNNKLTFNIGNIGNDYGFNNTIISMNNVQNMVKDWPFKRTIYIDLFFRNMNSETSLGIGTLDNIDQWILYWSMQKVGNSVYKVMYSLDLVPDIKATVSSYDGMQITADIYPCMFKIKRIILQFSGMSTRPTTSLTASDNGIDTTLSRITYIGNDVPNGDVLETDNFSFYNDANNLKLTGFTIEVDASEFDKYNSSAFYNSMYLKSSSNFVNIVY